MNTQYTDTDNYDDGITTTQDISSDDTSLTHVPNGKIVTKVHDIIWYKDYRVIRIPIIGFYRRDNLRIG